MVITETFNRFGPFRALVLGDFLLDNYTTGKVKRISPEAPVPVMEVTKQESRPGGAGNVALNLSAMGGKVWVVGRRGADSAGEEMCLYLSAHGIEISALLVEPGYRTPIKNRLLAEGQQLLRIDHETITSLTIELERQIIEQLEELIPQMDVVALSDYGKGFLTPALIASALQISRQHNIPSIVDPKGIEFSKYRGAYILKPNLSEAYAAAKMSLSSPLASVASHLLDLTAADLLLITRSEAGISLFDKQGIQFDFPVHSKEVIDVTGAGDTVLALICLALATRIDIQIGVQLANIAAGIAIERVGCVQVTLSEIAHRLLEQTAANKIFNASHSFVLHQVLQKKPYSLLVLDKEDEVLSVIRALREIQDETLLVQLTDPTPSAEFIHLLSSLQEVDYILLHDLKDFCTTLAPEKTYSTASTIKR